MDRRSFLKNSCIACIGISAGLSWESCNSIPVHKAVKHDKLLYIDETDLTAHKLNIIENIALPYGILLVRTVIGYDAILMRCSHQNQPLVVTGSGLYCNTHGSSFNLKGQVIKEPATLPLTKFYNEIKEGKIVIHLNQPASIKL